MKKEKKHLEVISNGLGAPSMSLLVLAARGVIPARISVTADTGSEIDRLLSTGDRITAKDYYEQVVEPYCRSNGIDSHFVRANDEQGKPMISLREHTLQMINEGRFNHIKMPLFGSNGGRLRQSCTSRWKIIAINQCTRYTLGAKTARFYQAIVMDEVPRRLKGINPRVVDGFLTYDQVERMVKTIHADGSITKDPRIRKWCTVCYPHADLRNWRNDCYRMCKEEKLPYLISSECDECPHKDLARWERSTPEVIDMVADMEARMDGQFFFTNLRIPIKEALVQLRSSNDKKFVLDFGCKSGNFCGV